MEKEVIGAGARVLEILREAGAYLEGHFKYTSGRHGSVYFEKIRIAQRPDLVDETGRMMAILFDDLRDAIDVVVSPAFGAIVFGFSTARHLARPFAFLQRDGDGRMTARPGFTVLAPGTRALLIEDVATTGGSLLESIEALREKGVSVEAAGLLVDRTGGRLELPVQCRSLPSVEAGSWPSESCPLCASGVPLSTPGSSGRKP